MSASARCPYCHDDLAKDEDAWTCGGCAAATHVGCWGEVGGRCPACGSEAGRRRTSSPLRARSAGLPPDGALLRLYREGGREALVARLLASGLGEAEAFEKAVEVVARDHGRPAPPPDPWGRLRTTLLAQAAGLLVAAGLAATTEAQAAVIAGLLACAVPLPFLVAYGWRSPGRVALLVLVNVAIVALGAVLVDACDVRRSRPSALLTLTGLVDAALTVGLAFLLARRRG